MNYLKRLAGGIRRQLAPGLRDQPDIDRLLLIYALVGMAKGELVTKEDVHDAWVLWRLLLGDDHEAMVPFGELAPEVRTEDEPYRQAIIAAIRAEKTAHSSKTASRRRG